MDDTIRERLKNLDSSLREHFKDLDSSLEIARTLVENNANDPLVLDAENRVKNEPRFIKLMFDQGVTAGSDEERREIKVAVIFFLAGRISLRSEKKPPQ